MNGTTLMWVLVILAALVVLALVLVGSRKATARRRAQQRDQASEIRDQATSSAAHADKDEAVAAEVEARARKARAAADEKTAEADRLEAGARERQAVAKQSRAEVDDQLRKADDLDPDVKAGRQRSAGAADGAGWKPLPDEREDPISPHGRVAPETKGAGTPAPPGTGPDRSRVSEAEEQRDVEDPGSARHSSRQR